jgi:hypothetical protein
LLSALIAAPSFDPVLREDVMRFPADHPFYGWGCGVVDCQRPKEPAHDFCRRLAGSVSAFTSTPHRIGHRRRVSRDRPSSAVGER